MAATDSFFQTLKGLCKIALLSRPTTNLAGMAQGESLIVLANGPSLSQTIADHLDILRNTPTLAVNFAAIAPEFSLIKPRYYVLADPHFFNEAVCDENMTALRANLATVDWPMTLFVPVKFKSTARKLFGCQNIATFNAVGIEGYGAVCNRAFAMGLAMPRPRNVLIPSLMIAIGLGYKKIYLTGADHSWMSSISVTDENEVVSIQPHFYADGKEEQARVRHEYRNYRLYQIVESFAVTFRSYHQIANYARYRGVKIINATPGSFIDAFPRATLDTLIKK